MLVIYAKTANGEFTMTSLCLLRAESALIPESWAESAQTHDRSGLLEPGLLDPGETGATAIGIEVELDDVEGGEVDAGAGANGGMDFVLLPARTPPMIAAMMMMDMPMPSTIQNVLRRIPHIRRGSAANGGSTVISENRTSSSLLV